jgi:superfamily I DNA and/or RNA helicase
VSWQRFAFFVQFERAEVSLSLSLTFEQAGVASEDMGVITPFRAQVNLLRRLLRDNVVEKCSVVSQHPLHASVEVNTVDQYQGRDKSVIIFSCVRTSPDHGKVRVR